MSDDRRDPAGDSSPRIHRLTRRRVIKYGALGAAAFAAGGAGLGAAFAGPWQQIDENDLRDKINACFEGSPAVAPFTVPLVIPPVARPTERTATDDVYFLDEVRGYQEFIPGIRTPIWGYAHPGERPMTPGPAFLARKGRRVVVTFRNRLPPNEDPGGLIVPSNSEQDEDNPFKASATVPHAHGMNTDPISDGYPESVKPPGGTQRFIYPNNSYQRPCLMWFHDHAVHITAARVYRGMAGLYILTDEIEDQLGLPGTASVDPGRGYGVYDVPLVVKDLMIAPEEMFGRPRGTLIYDNCSHDGAYGDLMMVNGRQQPYFRVANRKYRFRILNASDARQINFSLKRAENVEKDVYEPYTVIGTDHGLLPTPEETNFHHQVPAERVEIVIDFSKYPVGTRLVLVNNLIDPDNQHLHRIMAFDVVRTERDSSRIPQFMRGAEHPADTARPVRIRTWQFDRQGGFWSINSLQWDPNRVDARPRLNTNEEWVFINNSGGWGHPIHPHLGRFRVIRIDGRAPLPGELRGFKDTVWLGPNQTVRVIHQFWNFTGKFAFHCHNSTHEDHDMMTQFEVMS